jgi:hypothetical protein
MERHSGFLYLSPTKRAVGDDTGADRESTKVDQSAVPKSWDQIAVLPAIKRRLSELFVVEPGWNDGSPSRFADEVIE